MTRDEIIAVNLVYDPIETSPEHARGDHLVDVDENGYGDRWCRVCGERLLTMRDTDPFDVASPEAHVGHYSRLGGTYWCDTCNSPYCDLA